MTELNFLRIQLLRKKYKNYNNNLKKNLAN